MLVRCSQSKDVLEQRIFSSSVGVIFYGTPSIGTNKPAWAGLLQKLYRVTNRVTGSYLRPSADFDELGLIQTSFFDLVRQRDSECSPIYVYSIYEELPLPLIGTVCCLALNLSSPLTIAGCCTKLCCVAWTFQCAYPCKPCGYDEIRDFLGARLPKSGFETQTLAKFSLSRCQ